MPPRLSVIEQRVARHQAELKALTEYYETCEKTFEKYEGAWRADYAYIKRECGLTPAKPIVEDSIAEEPAQPEQGDEPLGINDDDCEPWAKRLYREIAKKTHPDRATDSVDPEAMEELFRAAAQAMDSGDHGQLISIASRLGIEPDIGSEEFLPHLKTMIAELRGKLQEIEASLAWSWCESFGDAPQKLGLLLQALEFEGLSFSDLDLLTSIIQTRESISV